MVGARWITHSARALAAMSGTGVSATMRTVLLRIPTRCVIHFPAFVYALRGAQESVVKHVYLATMG